MSIDLKTRLQDALGHTYIFDRELGTPGMSRVFLAEEMALRRKVVVKVLPADLAASVNLKRFNREIRLAAKLQQPHIVPVLSAGIAAGLPYYVMPFIEGESLGQKLAREGELSVPDTVRILSDVLSALAHAHEHGVVHRDIKPDNILLADNDAVVADFGIAKALSAAADPGSSLTSGGIALGTPAYMSPEQASGDPSTDHRTDIYAVGAMAYQMLTGEQVFAARSPQAMFAAHAVQIPEPISSRRPAVPSYLAELIMRSLEKQPTDRPQSAREMLAALDAMSTPSGGTIFSGKIPALPAASKASERRGLFMAILGAVVLLLLASSSWYWYKSKQPVPAETPSLTR
jgi:serine/threonine protein kinase